MGQFGQTPGDFGFTDPGGADHDDVFGRDFVPQFGRNLLAPPAVTQRHGNGALGVPLTDDVAVEFGYDFPGSEVILV